MIAILLALVGSDMATAPTYSLTSVCTVSTYGPEGETFNLEVGRTGNQWRVRLYKDGDSSWLVDDIVPAKNTIKLFKGEGGRQILFGQSRGRGGKYFYSVDVGADVVSGNATNFSVDVMRYGDETFSVGFERMVSADCENKSGKLGVEGLQ